MDTPIISPWRVARAKQSGVRSAGKNKPIRKDGGKKGILVLFARAGTADKILDPLDEIPEKHPPPSFSIDEKFERFSVNSSSTIMRIINFNVLPF